MYVASETEDAPSYEDAERTPLGSILRGAAVQCVKEDVDGGAELVRVENGLLDGKVSYLYMERANLAAAFGLPVDAVSVKATTEEHLGFTGEGLGIAAHAVALIETR